MTQNRISVPAEYDSVVIGSGFGGTIVSLAIAKMYKGKNENKRVCILERGQWWISHELPDSNAIAEHFWLKIICHLARGHIQMISKECYLPLVILEQSIKFKDYLM